MLQKKFSRCLLVTLCSLGVTCSTVLANEVVPISEVVEPISSEISVVEPISMTDLVVMPVDNNHWSFNDYSKLVELGYMDAGLDLDQPIKLSTTAGYLSNVLKPHGIENFATILLEGNITRIQFMDMAYNALSSHVPTNRMYIPINFNDTKDIKNTGSLEFALKLNLIKGDTDGNFRPYDELTVGELSAILMRINDHMVALSEG